MRAFDKRPQFFQIDISVGLPLQLIGNRPLRRNNGDPFAALLQFFNRLTEIAIARKDHNMV